jgi:hypothetical protein
MGMKMMWTILLASLVACSLDTTEPASAEADEPLGRAGDELLRRGLSKKQEATALDAIDDICGDTWCEGDHDFQFDELECSRGCRGQAGSCTLTFRVFSYDTDLETGPTFERSCRTNGFDGFESLLAKSGDYHSLQPDYYLALSACIDQVERDLPL